MTRDPIFSILSIMKAICISQQNTTMGKESNSTYHHVCKLIFPDKHTLIVSAFKIISIILHLQLDRYRDLPEILSLHWITKWAMRFTNIRFLRSFKIIFDEVNDIWHCVLILTHRNFRTHFLFCSFSLYTHWKAAKGGLNLWQLVVNSSWWSISLSLLWGKALPDHLQNYYEEDDMI